MDSSSSNRGSTGALSSTGGSTSAGMHHSLSTPAGVDCGGNRTPPTTPKKGGKMLAIRVQTLDDTITIFQVQAKAVGRVLFEQVCKQLHLLEADYFGLEYTDNHGTRYWLDLQKPISRQLGLSLVDPLLYFCVKFYTPDPAQLEEEYTRYLFCLQVKRDLSQGTMQCNENTAALMASYIVQAECGDFVAEDYPDHTYLSSYKFVPQQDHEMERKIMENHKKHAGQSPAEADLNLLETARRCEYYGMKLHPAKDHENTLLHLSVAHMGIVVFQNNTKINTFSWAKIRKISFKRKRFLIKLHPEGYVSKNMGYYRDMVDFFFEGRNECKNFWKKCVENHGFFRCASVKHVSRHKTRVLSRGSSFRYSGKTQKQIIEFVRDNYVKRQTFQRSQSFRHSSAHSSASNMHSHSTTVGNSISAHPLLPLADSNLSVEVSKLSASLGSMGAAHAGVLQPVSPTTISASHHLGTVMSWSSVPDTRPSILGPSQTTSSPEESATTSPLHSRPTITSSPLAVRAAVHRVDTGTIRTQTTTPTPSSHNFANNYPSQTQSQNDLGHEIIDTIPDYDYKTVSEHPKRQIWHRSASCKDLYDFSFEETGQAKRRAQPPKPLEKAVISFEERKLESPVTRYDDRPVYSASSRDSSLEIHQDIMVPDEKVYSSSYPGTTSYSQESVEDPGNYDLRDSQDDLSHDSYELIEKSDDDYSTSGEYNKYRKRKPFNTRSCSLDSNNYLPSDSESEQDKRQKCKSSNDVHQNLFTIEDPRDFPREIFPRKSDGSYYKQFKQISRNSSLESKTSKSSRESLKKSNRERGFGYRTSSQESRSDHETKKPERRNRSIEKMDTRNGFVDSRTSSVESKSEYFDAPSRFMDNVTYQHPYDRKISFERNYGIQKVPNHDNTEINRNFGHVHSISLQNVETEQNIKINRLLSNLEQNTVPRTQKTYKSHTVDHERHKSEPIWPDDVHPVWFAHQESVQRSTESESNIFSFDEDKIQSLQDSLDSDHAFSVVPNIDMIKNNDERKSFREIFMEIEPRISHDLPLHQPIERTKSDPNSLARQRLNSSNRRMLLMHQKSIDLTPAESSDEDYLYKQIPSAPPIMKYRDTHFEMPTAEFGHFDIIKREGEGLKTKFEVPKSQFEILGAKTQSDLTNLPPKDEELTYILHKRHVMNGVNKKDEPKTEQQSNKTQKEVKETSKIDETKKLNGKQEPEPSESQFLFTQNIDLSKIDPVTLEIDKTQLPVQHISSPKRDITHIDPVLLEALNSKLSQIESDSPTSSKTESVLPQKTIIQIDKPTKKESKIIEETLPVTKLEPKKDAEKTKTKLKTDIKPKRIIKPRMQPGKKGKANKTKVRITSFSSDDESLDSDDVFGSAEATPTRVEFSPPQMRKEMESILKFESERKYLQYTMSSTEVEGSPPTSRKKKDKKPENGLEAVPTELRRISERSFSIPSSEDDFDVKTTDLQPVFTDPLPEPLVTVEEQDIDETIKEDYSTDKELITINDEIKREEEKKLLQAEIENDLKNLQVPSKTRITEIPSPSLRKQGQSPVLFAHARLNLSEGSAFSLLQKQQALESPIAGRRAKSLDAPVIAVSRLPPLNAFSSKDDTVAEEDQQLTDKDSGLENYLISDKSTEERSDTDDGKTKKSSEDEAPNKPLPELPRISKPLPKLPDVKKEESNISIKEKERDQIVPDVNQVKSKKSSKTTLQAKQPQKVIRAKPPTKTSSKDKIIPKPSSVKTKTTIKPGSPKTIKPVQKASSAEGATKTEKVEQKSLSAQNSLTLPEVKRTKSQELEVTKKTVPKEKARSLEKLELKRIGSKERTKSQEEAEPDIAKRIEKQQLLYEIAIQQTKTLKSPVKDVLPVFPQVEEMVRERGGKLEISINTIEPSVSLEEAIIITKSPKKLDKKMGEKLTKSLDLNISEVETKTLTRLGKSLDLETSHQNSQQSTTNEFDFKPETIKSIQDKDLEENSPEIGGTKETVTADVHVSSDEDKIILKGTTLDVWLSVEDQNKKLQDIEIIRQSDDFFEERTYPKPPDLSKSSSDSQSMEKMSLGESLDIKYIDESTGDSSYKSEKDAKLIADMQKASNTVSKFLKKKLEKKREKQTENFARITSEEESLTEVSELKGETDKNLLAVSENKKDSLYNVLSIERSKSEDTGSWITVECEEYAGTEESLDYDNISLESPDKNLNIETEFKKPDSINLLTAVTKTKLDLLKRSSDQSKSSDTGSWTSGEKDISPKEVKETDDSSTSCAIGRAIGFSQHIETFTTKDLLDKGSPSESEAPRSPRSPRICVLGRAFTIDEGSSSLKLDDSSSDEANDIPKDLTPIQENIKEEEIPTAHKKYNFEEKWSNDSELTQRLQMKLTKKLSSADKSFVDDSTSDKRKNGNNLEKPLYLTERLSTESRNSLDTESSSGSIGAACRGTKSNDIPKGLSSTWKAFPLESSGSESFEDNLLPPDQDLEKEYFICKDAIGGDYSTMSDIYYKDNDVTPTKDDTELPEDLANFSTNFAYPLSTMTGLGLSSTDIFQNYTGGAYISRTLSRISERSTNSEKSSIDDDSTKASTQSDSLNDESLASSNPQVSISSESPSNARVSENEKKTPTNHVIESKEEDDKLSDLSKPSDKQQEPLPHLASLLQRQISDDRRTSAEMAELSMDDIEVITSERGLRLKRQGSDDTIIDEECFEPESKDIRDIRSSSQESEDWPLPEIPQQGQKLLAMHEFPSSDTSQQTTQVFKPPVKSIPRTFGLKGSLRSQDSEQWPSPPSSVIEQPIIGKVETFYITPPQEASKVVVDSSTVSIYDNDSNSDNENRTIDPDTEKTHTYENVACENISNISESLSDSLSVGPSGIKIVLEKKSQGSNSDEDLNISNLNDDVFVDALDSSKHELRPPTAMRRSTASDDSSHSHKSDKKSSKSSYSEEDCTSSMATNLDDGTVRFALKPTKCTHSSHSEDTSIALSLSEWSNSTNTVKFQNLSSTSGTTKSSSGLKSDENSLTDIAHSISDWSTSNTSSTLKAQHSPGLQFQKLSSTSTGDSTLTDRMSNISEWSTSETKPFFPTITEHNRLGSSIDIEEFALGVDQKGVPSPKNIPSEDFALLSTSLSNKIDVKCYSKSTERPIVIPPQNLSDTDKSSSSVEQRTVHIQRYDKDKQKYLQKHVPTKSTERPVKVPIKLSKCSPYYSSSLSSESTPLASTSPVPPYKTATVPLTRTHRKPVAKNVCQAKSPPSENDSTSSVESPKSKSDRDRRGYRRRKQLQNQRRARLEKEQQNVDEYYFVEHESGLTEYNEYLRNKNMEDIASSFQYESVLTEDDRLMQYAETIEEGYYPDDSQSGSDIMRMERDEEGFEIVEAFDVTNIPPPLLEDDFENDVSPQI
ncbi:uncharacterized protein LOC130443311 isoform X1 [Diorhabda sublineata]|uniref:uncharacterized protein LOC130443311 isoform X1 n=1 Tax=Diorhabda sublineata TaxID=1163346 RepID=UPI0024E0D62B|nr:uncharacterized protein LOC130443311 isoform X1 [Diorhabda sublineata]XP_056635049.1 uncharacterized protein LOC130443311 isoform X1 [Diorhabda sublineata]XP_056635830.1 uncharacterized protein LOC130443311 isoform X1 [Diorhabda sublineata]